MEYIIERGEKKHSTKDVLAALTALHRYSDIKKVTRTDEVWYSKEEPKQTAVVDNSWKREMYRNLREEFNAMPHTEEEHALDGVADMEWIADSLVPSCNAEHFKKTLYAKKYNTRGKGNARRN